MRCFLGCAAVLMGLFGMEGSMASNEKGPPAGAILLWQDVPPFSSDEDTFQPWLEAYPVETNEPRGAVLICPGGGYTHRAGHEAAPIARAFNGDGLHAFVVQYRVSPHSHPAPLYDAARALRIIRSRAKQWNVDPEHIAILGFSAGGHLAASLGVFHDEATPPDMNDEPLHQLSARPDALVLCYAVTAAGDASLFGTLFNLLGRGPTREEQHRLSPTHHVTEKTPPTFLWHTAEDDLVPPLQSLLFARALRSHGIPFELHVYAKGDHGMGLAVHDPHAATWQPLCAEWLQAMGW